MAALLLGLLGSHAARAAEPPPPDTLRVVFSPDKLSAVNRSDALASFKAWIETVGHRRGINVVVQANTYATVQDLKQILRTGSADLLIIRSMQYLDLDRERTQLDPLFMPEQQGSVQKKYLLLTRRADHLSLAGLRGKKIVLLNYLGASFSRTWLASLLRRSGLGSLDEFSPGAEEASKPSAAILPVYFGKADACVVEASSFRTMEELNPQIGQALEICETSPAFLESVICLRRDYTQHRTDLIEGLARLHDEVAGRQILMVFAVDRLMPFEDGALDTARELRATVGHGTGVASR